MIDRETDWNKERTRPIAISRHKQLSQIRSQSPNWLGCVTSETLTLACGAKLGSCARNSRRYKTKLTCTRKTSRSCRVKTANSTTSSKIWKKTSPVSKRKSKNATRLFRYNGMITPYGESLTIRQTQKAMEDWLMVTCLPEFDQLVTPSNVGSDR